MRATTRIAAFVTGAAARPVADRLVVPLLVLAVAALALGVFLPVIEVKNLVIFADRFSIADAAWRLLADGQYLLGAVIIVFSAVFPLGKAVIALVLWLRLRIAGSYPEKWIDYLEFFGRWSCADVFLVAISIVVVKSTGIADARMEIGLWFFTASIVLTAYAVHRVKRAVRRVVGQN